MGQRLEISASEQARAGVCVCATGARKRQGNITGQRKCVNNLQSPLPQDFETHDLAGLQISSEVLLQAIRAIGSSLGADAAAGVQTLSWAGRALAARAGDIVQVATGASSMNSPCPSSMTEQALHNPHCHCHFPCRGVEGDGG